MLTKGSIIPNLFCLKLDFGPTHRAIHVPNTHIPETLHSEILRGSVEGIYRETLKLGGLASRVLPGDPSHIVIGIKTVSGGILTERPKPLTRLLWALRGCGVVLCTGGSALALSSTWSILNSVTLAIGILSLKTALDIPGPAKATSRVLIYPRAKDRKGFGLVIIPFKLANQ